MHPFRMQKSQDSLAAELAKLYQRAEETGQIHLVKPMLFDAAGKPPKARRRIIDEVRKILDPVHEQGELLKKHYPGYLDDDELKKYATGPFFLGHTLQGTEIRWGLKDELDKIFLICGKSGSGKTTLAILLIRQILARFG